MTLFYLSKTKCGICFGGGGERNINSLWHKNSSSSNFIYPLSIQSFTV